MPRIDSNPRHYRQDYGPPHVIHYSTVTPRSIGYQRNGITGEGFWIIAFDSTEHYGDTIADPQSLIGVVFDYDEWQENPDEFRNVSVAVVDPSDLDSHFRGDNFALTLYQIIKDNYDYAFGLISPR